MILFDGKSGIMRKYLQGCDRLPIPSLAFVGWIWISSEQCRPSRCFFSYNFDDAIFNRNLPDLLQNDNRICWDRRLR